LRQALRRAQASHDYLPRPAAVAERQQAAPARRPPQFFQDSSPLRPRSRS